MLTAETLFDQLDAHGKQQRIMKVLDDSAEPLASFEVAARLLNLPSTPQPSQKLKRLFPEVIEILDGLVADGRVLTSTHRSMGGPKTCYFLPRTDLPSYPRLG